jgi:hypothetical protein
MRYGLPAFAAITHWVRYVRNAPIEQKVPEANLLGSYLDEYGALSFSAAFVQLQYFFRGPRGVSKGRVPSGFYRLFGLPALKYYLTDLGSYYRL